MQSTDTAARLSDIEKEELAFNKDIKKKSSDADTRYNSYKAEYGKKKAAEAKEFLDEEKSLTKKIAASKGVQQFDLQADLNKLRKKKKERDAERERDLQAEKKKYDEIKKKIAIEQQDKRPYLAAEKAALRANLQREEAARKDLARREAQIKQEAERKQAQAERTLSADKAKKEKERIALERKKKLQALADEEKKFWEKRKQEETARRARVEQQQKQIAERRAAEAKAWKEAECRRMAKLEAEQKAINDKMRADDERRAAEDKRLRRKLADNTASAEDCGCDLKCMPGWSAGNDLKVTNKTGNSAPVRLGCFKDKPAMHIEYRNGHNSAKLKTRLCFKRWDESQKAYVWRNWSTATLKPGESSGDWSCETSEYRLYQKKEDEVEGKKKEFIVDLSNIKDCKNAKPREGEYCIDLTCCKVQVRAIPSIWIPSKQVKMFRNGKWKDIYSFEYDDNNNLVSETYNHDGAQKYDRSGITFLTWNNYIQWNNKPGDQGISVENWVHMGEFISKSEYKKLKKKYEDEGVIPKIIGEYWRK